VNTDYADYAGLRWSSTPWRAFSGSAHQCTVLALHGVLYLCTSAQPAYSVFTLYQTW